jgi:beta-phosphoglucomutase
MAGKTIKAIIFDMDGVLVNSEPHHVIIERRLFARLGLNITDEEHRTYLGKSSEQMWKEVTVKHNLKQTSEVLAKLNSEEIIRYFSDLSEIELMPGVRNLLDWISDWDFPMAVASSSDPETIELMLTKTGLTKYFQHTVSCATVGKSKPEPDIYLYTAGLLSVNPEECIVVEDSSNGIKAAKSAKMVCIEYRGFNSANKPNVLADDSIDDFTLLPEILKKYA